VFYKYMFGRIAESPLKKLIKNKTTNYDY